MDDKISTIEVLWNDRTKQAGYKCSADEFPNPEFVAAVLGMAHERAKAMVRLCQVQQMQHEVEKQVRDRLVIANGARLR